MARINLLPWREELRKKRQKDFALTAVLAVILMGFVIAGVHLEFNNRIDFQQQRNQFLQAEMAKLDSKIKKIRNIEKEKKSLLARMQIIQQLQSSRPEIVHLFDELVTTLPEGVYFTKIVQTGRELTLSGVAQSNARVSTLMRNLEKSRWLEKPDLIEIKRRLKGGKEALRLSDFSLRISQTAQNKDEEPQ